jgi:hypothetical protein
MIKEYSIDVVENPTYGQFIDALTLIGVTEKQFRDNPEEALTKAKNLDLAECQQLLDLISSEKISLRDETLSAARHVIGIATSFFLAESLKSIVVQKITESGYMSPKAYLHGSQAERIMALTLLLQQSVQSNTQNYADGD